MLQYKNYFNDAMDYFKEEYENVVFLYVSDEMEWGTDKLGSAENLFFVGCGDGDDMDTHGVDINLLSSSAPSPSRLLRSNWIATSNGSSIV